MTEKCPTFAVVGHPNKGKSSIVATLTHDDSVRISELSGTTLESSAYQFQVAGETLYKIYDTPGFQRPRQTFEEIESLASNAAERLPAVLQFISNNREVSSRYHDEVELLRPIIEGAGIIYVVDGSVPYTPEYEAEMEILQWTGRPRMALINPIAGDQYIGQWQNALGQYFSLVQVFNPMTASLENQLAVLAAFGQLTPEWSVSLSVAVEAIKNNQTNFMQTVAYVVTEYILDVVAFSVDLPLVSEDLKKATQSALRKAYSSKLLAKEKALQGKIIQLYKHNRLVTDVEEISFDAPDLLDQDHWYLFGLSKAKLIGLSSLAGAAAGAVLDLGMGGSSLMAGSMLGGLTAGAASLWASSDPAAIKVKGVSLGGEKLVAGPIKDAQFRFVLLGRALYFQNLVANHTHANRDPLSLKNKESEHWIDALDKSDQVKLARFLSDAQKGLNNEKREKLMGVIERLLK